MCGSILLQSDAPGFNLVCDIFDRLALEDNFRKFGAILENRLICEHNLGLECQRLDVSHGTTNKRWKSTLGYGFPDSYFLFGSVGVDNNDLVAVFNWRFWRMMFNYPLFNIRWRFTKINLHTHNLFP